MAVAAGRRWRGRGAARRWRGGGAASGIVLRRGGMEPGFVFCLVLWLFCCLGFNFSSLSECWVSSQAGGRVTWIWLLRLIPWIVLFRIITFLLFDLVSITSHPRGRHRNVVS